MQNLLSKSQPRTGKVVKQAPSILDNTVTVPLQLQLPHARPCPRRRRRRSEEGDGGGGCAGHADARAGAEPGEHAGPLQQPEPVPPAAAEPGQGRGPLRQRQAIPGAAKRAGRQFNGMSVLA